MHSSPILILGAGINGVAIARELALNGRAVYLVDTADITSGTTAYSSRLIHGGLRYLEFGEFDLVRESLDERRRLLELAAQFVRPLELFIPLDSRWGGLWTTLLRFLRLGESRAKGARRGLWLVRIGLWLYDRYARDPLMPKHRAHRCGDPAAPQVACPPFRWLCSYWDAQVPYAERLVLAMLRDAVEVADERGTELRVFTYHSAELAGERVVIRESASGDVVAEFAAAAVINATGAWVDQTLRKLALPADRQIGGTKGSHLFTRHRQLRQRLAGRGIYAEAADGRPVFLLPLADGVLIGTTDIPFERDPADAVADAEEIDYLLAVASGVFEEIALTPTDIAWHYSGVRPLPYVDATMPGAITRRHWLEEHPHAAVPFYSVIGGKLTTCRSLAEEAVATVLGRLGERPTANSRERPLPGGRDYPRDVAALAEEQHRLAANNRLSVDQVHAGWKLFGRRLACVLEECLSNEPPGETPANLSGSDYPLPLVRWIVRHEWVRTLEDLVERRLMLLYDRGLSRQTLEELADLLVDEKRLDAEKRTAAITACAERLEHHFGLRLEANSNTGSAA